MDLRLSRPQAWLPHLLLALGISVVAFVGSGYGQGLLERAHHHLKETLPVLSEFASVELVRELGMALAIIGLVTLSVERARITTFTSELQEIVTRELIRIEQRTSDAIMQGPLPRGYYEQVSKIMLLNRFVRTDWTVHLRFSWKDGDPTTGYLVLTYQQEYRIENRDGVEREYQIDHLEATDWEEEYPGSTRIEYVRAKLNDSEQWILSKKPGSDEMTLRTQLDDKEDGDIRFRELVSVPSGASLTVHALSTKIVRRKGYDDLLIGEPTLRLQCWVEHPKDVRVYLDYPEIHERYGKGGRKPEEQELEGGQVQCYWEFNSPMPPFSYYIVDWYAKAQKSAPSRQAM